jgi:hypothetical protein
MKSHVLRTAALAWAGFIYFSAFAQVNVLTYHNNNSRTGENLQETILTPSNVKTRSFGKLFAYQVDGYVYAQPLYVSGLNIPGQGTFNVVFVATEHNSVYAFDADRNTTTGSGLLWHVNLGPSAPTPSTDFGNQYGAFNDIVPEVGITSTPVIDLASETIYVDAFIYDGQSYFHKLHALDIRNGAQRSFSPVVVSAAISGRGIGSINGVLRFQAKQQIQRAALTLVGSTLYVAFASYADTDPYHGWIIGYNARNLQQLQNYVFCSTPNSTEAAFGSIAGGGGIWMSGCGLSVDANNNLYFATGDGAFNAKTGGTEIANSFVKLSTANRLSIADYFTPWNQAHLASHDLDLGSGGVMLLPDQPGPFRRLMIGAGKSGLVYLMNRDMMTTGNNHHNTNSEEDFVLQTVSLQGGSFDTPAYFNGTIYYAGSGDVLTALTLSNGVLPTVPTSLGPRVFGFPGATPSVSANGIADGIVWAIQRANPAVLAAYNATNLSRETYNSSQAGKRDRLADGVKFAVPTVANGKVYVGGQYALSVFGLLTEKASSSFTVATYSGLFYERNAIQQGTSGALNVRITKRGSYSATLQIGGRRYQFSGQLDPSGAGTTTINRKGENPLTLNLQVKNTDNGSLSGTVTDGAWIADLTAYRAVFNTRINPSPAAGKYTLILPGGTDGNTQIPQGNGFGSVIVSASGQVKFSGSLADGTKAVQTGSISEDGQWPVYLSLYQGGGQLLGWVNFAMTSNKDLEGSLSWIKLENAQNDFYPLGFEMNLAARGSSYEVSGKNVPVLQFSDGQVVLSGDGLTGSLVNNISIDSNNKVTNRDSNNLTLSFVPATGLFKGNEVNPEDSKIINFRGIVLQDENAGFGYFLRNNQSGKARIAPR